MILKMRAAVLLIACLAASAARPAGAQEQFDQVTGIDNVTAQRQIRIGPNHRQLIENVELKLGDAMLYADEVEVFTDQDRIVARGNVTLVQTTNRISADSAEFNYRTKLGVFRSAAGIASVKPQAAAPGALVVPTVTNQETDVYFAGEVIEKIGPRKYKITKGGFTTCVQPTPRWKLSAETVVLNLEHSTFLRNAVFDVKGVPLLYMPVFYYPTKNDRATGLLIPTIGSTTLRGESIHNAFFWVLGRSQDVTFLHDWFSKTGMGYGSEYRYNFGGLSNGYIHAVMLKEHSADYPQDDGTVSTRPGSTSYEIHGAATQMLPEHILARGRVDYFSSVAEMQSYTMNYANAYVNQRSFGGNAVGAWSTYSMNATVDHTEYFSSDTASATSGSWPKFSLNRNERLIPGTPLYFAASGEFAGLLRNAQDTANPVSDYNQDVTRFDFNPQIRFPFKKWQWFTVNSTLAWRETHYSRSLAFDPATNAFTRPVDTALNRTFYTMSAQILGPVFNRVWDTPDNGYAEKFKHTVEPFVNISRTTSIDNFAQIINIDGTDQIFGGTTQYAYGVNNRFYAKRPGVGGQRSQPREIFDVQLSQTYYTNPGASQYDPRYSTSSYTTNLSTLSNFSPILISMRGMPTNDVNATASIEIDSRYLALRQVSVGGSYAWTNRIQTTASWSKRAYIPQLAGFNDPANLTQAVTALSNVHTKDNKYGGIYAFSYDVFQGRMLNQRIASFYNTQCCGVAFEYQTFNYGGVTQNPYVSADHRFFLSFTLAGLGNFSPFNGAMSGMTR